MIVTLCGAYRNAGDHLIGARARALLRTYIDPDIVTIDRKQITPDHYALFNRAKAVILCGGPAYQREIYPKIYPIERERITAPIIPFGLGWKSPVGTQPATFQFKPEATKFVSDVHANITQSSARDPLTVEMLAGQGIDNVLMTGCPAWYDLEHLNKPYVYNGEPKVIVLSMPAKLQPGTYELMLWLTKRFPKATRILTFHHGIVPAKNRTGLQRARSFVKFSAAALMRGWKVNSLAGSLSKLEHLYGNTGLHVGYRVHAHLFCLSRRISSILVNEDSRGVGQVKALRAKSLIVDGKNIEPIQAEVEEHFATRGEAVARAAATMQDTFPTMLQFLRTL